MIFEFDLKTNFKFPPFSFSSHLFQIKKPRNAALFWRYFIMMDIVVIFFILLIVYFKRSAPFTDSLYSAPQEGFFDRPRNLIGTKIDWHDYKLIGAESRRTGIGEQGKAAFLSGRDKEKEAKMSIENGFNALLSDKISVNRSVPDIRNSA
jgi:hypothetical protein